MGGASIQTMDFRWGREKIYVPHKISFLLPNFLFGKWLIPNNGFDLTKKFKKFCRPILQSSYFLLPLQTLKHGLKFRCRCQLMVYSIVSSILVINISRITNIGWYYRVNIVSGTSKPVMILPIYLKPRFWVN